ncbi:MAG: sulfate adenylyltransferase [Sulfurimonas sp.]|jgi:sulfate adenylyltransferase|uniref:sulfate adenylyltransferase n=1 Tax=Sulfurimonas sp. TaxID=2022749 RepID=UPI0039E478BA
MTLSRKNKTLLIDREAASALEILKCGLLKPLTELMSKKQKESIIQTGKINDTTFPIPLILGPSGAKNEEVIKSLKKGEELTILCEGKEFATLIVDETFKTDPQRRTKHIFGTDDLSHPGVQTTINRLGTWAVCGPYELVHTELDQNRINQEIISSAKRATNAKHTTALILGANPLHRAHERLIRQAIDTTDLLIIFLLKPYEEKNLKYDLRHEALEFFVNNFLPKNRVVIVPLENSYIFAGYNELIVNAIVAQNYGCDRLTISRDHTGLGIFYDENAGKSIIDNLVGIDIEVKLESEYVYCNQCTTLVGKHTCPHGQHHQISYHSDSILELLELGLLPPTILIRKEISAFLLSKLFPNRFKNLEKLYSDILPVEGLLREHTESDFYIELMKLYQTTSLT